ncbi:MAG: DNA polymerase III subunit beta [Candidatus Sumerlaeaceae bacterium]|jgi:DNA polymerase-3 subunit beta
MRIQFKAGDLVRGAEVAQSVANPQSTMPILAQILIKGEHNNLASLTAMDFDVRVRVEVPAEVEVKGQITVPARTFYDFVRELPSDSDVLIEAKGDKVTVTCRDIRGEMATMPAEDFPVWPEMESKLEFEMAQKDLQQVLDKVLFTVPVRDMRKTLLGALFEIRKTTLNVVGTDGKILACARQSISSEKPPKEFNAIVPRKLLEELDRNLNDEGLVSVAFNEKQVSFRLGNILYLSNQVEGTYPDYTQVIPKQFARRFHIQKPPLLAAIRRAAIFTDQRQNSVTLEFRGDKVAILADSYDRGRFFEELPAVVEGGDFRIAFNYKFLQDVLKALSQEEVLLQANQNSMPAIWRAENADDCFYVVMPVKIQERTEIEETAVAEEGESEA